MKKKNQVGLTSHIYGSADMLKAALECGGGAGCRHIPYPREKHELIISPDGLTAELKMNDVFARKYNDTIASFCRGYAAGLKHAKSPEYERSAKLQNDAFEKLIEKLAKYGKKKSDKPVGRDSR